MQFVQFLNMCRREREELAKAIVTHHIHCAHSVLKNTVNHFASQGISQRTVYIIIKKYSTHLTIHFLPKSGRPSKISDKQLKALVQTVENKTGVSQHRLGRRFGIHYSTISRVLKSRTSVLAIISCSLSLLSVRLFILKRMLSTITFLSFLFFSFLFDLVLGWDGYEAFSLFALSNKHR